jgi:hypothetical protein
MADPLDAGLPTACRPWQPQASWRGPSHAQPLACLARARRFWEGSRAVRPHMRAYDAWSLGVVWLELLLGGWPHAHPAPCTPAPLHPCTAITVHPSAAPAPRRVLRHVVRAREQQGRVLLLPGLLPHTLPGRALACCLLRAQAPPTCGHSHLQRVRCLTRGWRLLAGACACVRVGCCCLWGVCASRAVHTLRCTPCRACATRQRACACAPPPPHPAQARVGARRGAPAARADGLVHHARHAAASAHHAAGAAARRRGTAQL